MTVPGTLTGTPTDPAGTVLTPRYEVLPFRSSLEQAAQVASPLRLTVTVSPKHGVDRSLDHAVRLRQLGHQVSLHVAARQVRDARHVDELLERSAAAGIDDFLVIGGDAPQPVGDFDASTPVLELIGRHPLRPARLGIGAYPEGHPLIARTELDAALAAKAPLADYLVTQLCFDPIAFLDWLEDVRGRGIALPVFAGAVGPVDRLRLLEISTKIGVGPSLRFLRKQRGLSGLLRRRASTASAFRDGVAPHVAGFHLFTFGDLPGTIRWYDGGR